MSLGFHVPFGRDGGAERPTAPPEVNAWVVIKPDDTVVIRIARSEMGQGTLTGLAQLVAEELECDWSKVTTEYPTPGENLARKRVWGNFSTGGSRGIRESQRICAQGRRRGARDADRRPRRRNGRCRPAECSAANSVITHKPIGPHSRATARSRRPRPSSSRRRTSSSRTPRTGRSPASRVKRLDTARQADRQAGLRHRHQAARHADRGDQATARCTAARSRASTPPRSRGCAA